MSRKRTSSTSCADAAKKRAKRVFSSGDYVKWRESGERKEAVVLQDDGVTLHLQGASTQMRVERSSEFRKDLEKSAWRSLVQVNDVLMMKIPKCDWHVAKVRHIDRGRTFADTQLVVEPAFYGTTMWFTLSSLCLKKLHKEDKETECLLESGFAFDSINVVASKWPKKQLNGVTQRLDHVDATCWGMLSMWHSSSGAWKIRAPCELPRNVAMVRQNNGILAFCKDCELLPKRNNIYFKRIRLGTVRLPVRAPQRYLPLFFNDQMLEFMKLRDVDLMARLMLTCSDKIVDVSLCKEHAELQTLQALAHALAIACCPGTHNNTPEGSHIVASSVWHHWQMAAPVYRDRDLETLENSLQKLYGNYGFRDNAQSSLDELSARVGVWRHYSKVWGNARKMQLLSETKKPVDARIVQMVCEDSQWYLEFEVHANIRRGMLSRRSHVCCNMSSSAKYVTCIMQHFSQRRFEGGLEYEKFMQRLEMSWDDAMDVVAETTSQQDIGMLMLRREDTCLSECVLRCARSQDNRHQVVWNMFEGPFEAHLAVDEVATLCERTGGVLVNADARLKMRHVTDMLLTEAHGRHGCSPADKGSTMIVTSPTLMHQWQAYLTKNNVPSHTFSGVGRRGPAMVEAMHRGDVILATPQAVVSSVDSNFLRTQGAPIWRLVLDEFDSRFYRNTVLVDSIISFSVGRLWLLAPDYSKDMMALALPLMKVRPFTHRDGWNTDLVTHYKKRAHVSALFNFDEVKVRSMHSNVMFQLCSTLFVVGDLKMPSVRFKQCLHTPKELYGKEHRRMLECLSDNVFLEFAGVVEDSELVRRKNNNKGKFVSMLQVAQHAAWGIPPPVKMLSDRVVIGKYNTCADQHLWSWKPLREDEEGTESQKTALCLFEQMKQGVYNNTTKQCCPICMDEYGQHDSAASLMKKSLVMGYCGHSVCGDCAENIHRAAHDNRLTALRDYGPNAPVNAASCPICRESWKYYSPLIACMDPEVKFEKVKDDVVHAMRCSPYASSYEKSPMLQCMQEIMASVRQQHGLTTRIVVVSHSAALTQHLYEQTGSNADAVWLSGGMPSSRRGRALRLFHSNMNVKNTLFITASLMRGMVLEGVQHYVFADCLTETEAETVQRVVRGSQSRQCQSSVSMHTIKLPAMHGNNQQAVDLHLQGHIPIMSKLTLYYKDTLRELFGIPEVIVQV